MAINDIDHVFHVIYEKFAENQKDKKYENRIYIAEDEFIHDLKEFVKKSEVEDKGLLISEIYRSVSEDALEISSDGKITVSPKVLRKVENKILERKEQEEKLKNNKNEIISSDEKENKKLDIKNISREQFQKLSFEEKVELASDILKDIGIEVDKEDVESFMKLGEEDLSKTLSDNEDDKRKQVLEWLGGEENPTLMKLGIAIYETRMSLLKNGPCGELFAIDGKPDMGLLLHFLQGISDIDELSDINETYLSACDQYGISKEEGQSRLDKINANKVSAGILQDHIHTLVITESQKDELGKYADILKNMSLEDRENAEKMLEDMTEKIQVVHSTVEKEDVSHEELKKVVDEAEQQRVKIKPRNLLSKMTRNMAKEVDEIVISGKKTPENLTTAQQQRLKRLEGIKNGTRKKRVIKNNSIRTIDGLLVSGDKKTIKLTGKIEKGSNVKVEKDISQDEPVLIRNEAEEENALEDAFDMEITDFEVDSFSAMFEDIQLEPMEEPVVEDEAVDLEPSSAPEVIAENNSAIHAETIDVEEPEEKVVQQVEEQAVEENVRNDIESNLPKELTWVDRAKQGLFKVGKTISNVIKAVTDKDSSKGLFERIADAINSDNNSTSDSSSSSGTSSSAGPSVDEKPIQAPVDYLNTQFKVDVKLAAETAKAASEKQAQRRDASSELTQDEEQL